jgi:hypothetical protein
MIGTEGLHGWVDRKASEYYYGLEFYAPAPLQLTDGPGPSLRTHLWVTKVAKGSLADTAGIRPLDYVADVNDLKPRDPNTAYLRLLSWRPRQYPVAQLRPQRGPFLGPRN